MAGGEECLSAEEAWSWGGGGDAGFGGGRGWFFVEASC